MKCDKDLYTTVILCKSELAWIPLNFIVNIYLSSYIYFSIFCSMIFILHTSSSELPEGGIGAAAHGHSHSHSHSHNHGHNHSHNHHHGHSQHSSSPQSVSPHLQRHLLHRTSVDGSHLHLEHSVRSSLVTASSGDGVDTSESTSIEFSPGPLDLDGSGLKHHHHHHEDG